MPSPWLDQMKATAQILVPLIRAFRSEFGTERTNQIVWQVLAEWRQRFAAESLASVPGPKGAQRWMDGMRTSNERIGDAVDMDFLRADNEAVHIDITGCRFAELFKELDEPELGFALLCSMDDATTAELGGDEVEFKRSDTIMQGAARCDFRYALKKKGLL